MTFLHYTFAVRFCWICYGSPFSVVLSHCWICYGSPFYVVLSHCWICYGSPFSVVLSHYMFLFGFLRLTLLCGSFIEPQKLVGGKAIDRYRVFSVRYSLFSVLFQDAQVIL